MNHIEGKRLRSFGWPAALAAGFQAVGPACCGQRFSSDSPGIALCAILWSLSSW